MRSDLATPFGFLYGGSGIAASAEAAEQTTGRPLQWITTQFIGSPPPASVVDLQVMVVADGRATTQSQVVATVDGNPMFTSLCAHTVRPSGDGAQFIDMPTVPAPDDCEEMAPPFDVDLSRSFFGTLDRRIAAGQIGQAAIESPQRGLMAIWCRVRDHEIGTPASQAFVADIIPLAIGAALGALPGATSLDNTLRVHRSRTDRLGAARTRRRGIPPLHRSRIAANLGRGRATEGDRSAVGDHPHQPPRPPLTRPTATEPGPLLDPTRQVRFRCRCRSGAIDASWPASVRSSSPRRRGANNVPTAVAAAISSKVHQRISWRFSARSCSQLSTGVGSNRSVGTR